MSTARRRNPSLHTVTQRFLAACDERVEREELTPHSRFLIAQRLEYSAPLWDTPVAQLDEARLSRWLHTMRHTPAVALLCARTLRQALLWGRREGLVLGDPAACIVTPRHKAKRGDPLSADAVRLFIEACQQLEAARLQQNADEPPLMQARRTSIPAALQLLALTALRSGAVCGIQCIDYCAADPSVRVRTKGRIVRVPLSRPAADVLNRRVQLIAGTTSFLFPGQTAGGIRTHSLNKAFKDVADGLGIRGTRHVNDLRHTGITIARLAGASWDDAAELAGHSNSRTTRTVYDHSKCTPTGVRTAESVADYIYWKEVRRG